MLESTMLAVGAALTCLAQNIYFESRDQSTIGQIAVAEVTLNRVADPRWPNDVCSVVKQGPTYKWKKTYPIKHRCEFSWYCYGKSDAPKNKRAWSKSVQVISQNGTSFSKLIMTTSNGLEISFKSSASFAVKFLTDVIKTMPASRKAYPISNNCRNISWRSSEMEVRPKWRFAQK